MYRAGLKRRYFLGIEVRWRMERMCGPRDRVRGGDSEGFAASISRFIDVEANREGGAPSE